EEFITCDCERRRNGINGKNQVGSFNQNNNKKQRRKAEPVVDFDDELSPKVFGGHREVTLAKTKDRIFFRFDFLVPIFKVYSYSRVDEEHTEHIQNPMVFFYQ